MGVGVEEKSNPTEDIDNTSTQQAINKLKSWLRTEDGESTIIKKMINYLTTTTSYSIEFIDKINSDTTYPVIKSFAKNNKIL
jgi:23S rRNA A1618 N6-methylase RlmF